MAVHLLLLAAHPANSEPRGFCATMIRREKTVNFTRAAQQSYKRLSLLAARRLDAAARERTSTETPLRADSNGEYDMEISIGTPPQKLTACADTGSDHIWVKCGRCASCTPPGSPSFEPAGSSTFSPLPCSHRLCEDLESRSAAACGGEGGNQCDYRYSYGLSGAHYTQGLLANETVRLGNVTVPGVGFGCTNSSNGDYGTGSGVVGLGRRQLSLVSQLNVGAFSYCLTDDSSVASPLLFGSLAGSSGGAGVQSTRLLPSRTFYNVQLNSITIGDETTPGAGADGTIFDSGTTLAFLAEPAYTAAKNAVLSQTPLPRAADRDGFEACSQLSRYYNGSGLVPAMVLHFAGACMRLPVANYFQEVEPGVACWLVQRSPSMSIIGNLMQMNYHIRYDLHRNMLSFQRANCYDV